MSYAKIQVFVVKILTTRFTKDSQGSQRVGVGHDDLLYVAKNITPLVITANEGPSEWRLGQLGGMHHGSFTVHSDLVALHIKYLCGKHTPVLSLFY